MASRVRLSGRAAWAALGTAGVLAMLAHAQGPLLSVHGPLFLLAMPGLLVASPVIGDLSGGAYEAAFFVGNVVAWYLLWWTAEGVVAAVRG